MSARSDFNMAIATIRAGRAALILFGILIAAWLAMVYANYQGDIHRAWARISTGSQVIQTACGPIEYAVAGSGAPVLFIHGAGGGYDQGLDESRDLISGGFRVIVMSRFGYLRTPLPADACPAAQADAHACLLDALGVERTAVIGLSAGGPSAMQFALRHPERTSALILLVAAAYPTSQVQHADGAVPKRTSPLARAVFDLALKSDFLFWAAPRLAAGAMDQALLGVPPGLVEHASLAERARVAETRDHLLPFSARRLGVLNDSSITPFLPRYDLERIAAPTLIISAADDGYGTYAGAQYSAEHIPGARFIGYPDGGHLLIGHYEAAMSEVQAFLTLHAP